MNFQTEDMSQSQKIKSVAVNFRVQTKAVALVALVSGLSLGCGGSTPSSSLGYIRYDFPANRIATDLVTNKIWGTFGSSSIFPNSIVEIDARTGHIGVPIPVGSEPGAISVSADGTVAYVGLDGSSKVRKVDLVFRTVGPLISYSSIETDPQMVPDKIAVNPTNFNEFVIGVRSTSGGFKRGPYYFRDNAVVGAPNGIIDGCEAVSWINGTDFMRLQSGGSGLITRYGATPTMVNTIKSVFTHFDFTGNFHFTNSGIIVTDQGRMFDPSDYSLVATLSFAGQSFLSVDTDPNRNIAWATMGGTSPATIRSYELANYTPTSALTVDMNGEDYGEFKRFGPNGLVVSSRIAVYVIPNAPGL